MAMTEYALQQGIEEFASKISDQPLVQALHRPDANAKHTNCIANVLTIKEELGGSVCYGWYFLYRSHNHPVWLTCIPLPSSLILLTVIDILGFQVLECERFVAQC